MWVLIWLYLHLNQNSFLQIFCWFYQVTNVLTLSKNISECLKILNCRVRVRSSLKLSLNELDLNHICHNINDITQCFSLIHIHIKWVWILLLFIYQVFKSNTAVMDLLKQIWKNKCVQFSFSWLCFTISSIFF